MQQLANVATSDAYTPACTLGPLPTAQQLVYVVANASAYMQLSPTNLTGTAEDFLPEILVPPSSNLIARVTGARWRSAVPGSPAQIVAQLIQPDDPAPGAGTPFSSTLAASGAVGSGVQIPVVTLANFPPPSPADQQVIELHLPSTFDPVGGKPTRWLCSYDAANAIWHVQGPPLYAEVQTKESTGSATYADLTTVGPSITIPRPGDYIIEQGSDQLTQAGLGGGVPYMAYSIAGGGAADADAASSGSAQSSTDGVSVARAREKAGLAASSAIVTKYRTNSGVQAQFSGRYLTVLPLRIT